MDRWVNGGINVPSMKRTSGQNCKYFFCGKDRGRPVRWDDMPRCSACRDDMEIPARLASGFACTKKRQRAYFFSDTRMAQVQLPPVDPRQRKDLHCCARKIVGATLKNSAWLAQTPHSPIVRQWLRWLETCYRNEHS